VPQLAINEKYQPPTYVWEGLRVMAPFVHEGKRVGLWCVVVVAAGDHARVMNTTVGFDRWFRIDHLRVETPRGPRALKRLLDPKTGDEA
jgi:hypothetical protein